MPLTKIACPECGSPLTSTAGYTVGKVTTCAKCEAEFMVEDPALVGGKDEVGGGPPDPVWSYRTSSLRYLVLAVLIGVMGVLGYMLYDKKAKEREMGGGLGDDEKVQVLDPNKVKFTPGVDEQGRPRQMLGGPAAVGGFGAPPAGGAKGTGNFVPTGEIGKKLQGTWVWTGEGGETATIEYDENGPMRYTATGADVKQKELSGGWAVAKVDQPAEPSAPLVLPMQWTIRVSGTGARNLPNAQVTLSGDKLEGHPLIHKTFADPKSKASGTFVKKK